MSYLTRVPDLTLPAQEGCAISSNWNTLTDSQIGAFFTEFLGFLTTLETKTDLQTILEVDNLVILESVE